jgi:hypothetical protein
MTETSQRSHHTSQHNATQNNKAYHNNETTQQPQHETRGEKSAGEGVRSPTECIQSKPSKQLCELHWDDSNQRRPQNSKDHITETFQRTIPCIRMKTGSEIEEIYRRQERLIHITEYERTCTNEIMLRPTRERERQRATLNTEESHTVHCKN